MEKEYQYYLAHIDEEPVTFYLKTMISWRNWMQLGFSLQSLYDNTGEIALLELALSVERKSKQFRQHAPWYPEGVLANFDWMNPSNYIDMTPYERKTMIKICERHSHGYHITETTREKMKRYLARIQKWKKTKRKSISGVYF